jgi:hypothetical protein
VVVEDVTEAQRLRDEAHEYDPLSQSGRLARPGGDAIIVIGIDNGSCSGAKAPNVSAAGQRRSHWRPG